MTRLPFQIAILLMMLGAVYARPSLALTNNRPDIPNEYQIRRDTATPTRVQLVGGGANPIRTTTANKESSANRGVGSDFKASGSDSVPLALDINPPGIRGVMSAGQWVSTGDSIGVSTVFEAGFFDIDSTISSWNISLNDASNQTLVSENRQGETQSSVTASMRVTSPLPNGIYSLRLEVWDSGGNYSASTISNLRAESALRLSGLISGPNPLIPNQSTAVIEYQLSRAADIDIKIVAMNGRMIWTDFVPAGRDGASPGFNRVSWNGRDGTGEMVANGPYLIVVTARSGSDRVSGRNRLLVIK